jgi:hypothetical protein
MNYNKYWLGGWGLHEKQLTLMTEDLKNENIVFYDEGKKQ